MEDFIFFFFYICNQFVYLSFFIHFSNHFYIHQSLFTWVTSEVIGILYTTGSHGCVILSICCTGEAKFCMTSTGYRMKKKYTTFIRLKEIFSYLTGGRSSSIRWSDSWSSNTRLPDRQGKKLKGDFSKGNFNLWSGVFPAMRMFQGRTGNFLG